MYSNFQRQLKSLSLGILFFLCVAGTLHAQYTIGGPTNVNQNQSYDYWLNAGPGYVDAFWYIGSGSATIISSNPYSATVQWTGTGSGSLTIVVFDYNYDSYAVDLTVSITSSGPATPTLSSVTQPTCTYAAGSFTITNYSSSNSYTANPSSGVTISGATVTAPQGNYTITATSGGNSSSPSASKTVNTTPSNCTNDENFIHTITPRIASTNISNLTGDQKIESIAYFDGLGRPMQSVNIRAGGNQQDLITHIDYDDFGRREKEFLPYPILYNNGLYKSDAETATNSFYKTKFTDDFSGINVNDINPYSQKEFESSPLNRVLKQAAPGKDWKLGNGHEIEFDYQTNEVNEVRYYEANTTPTVTNNITIYNPTLNLNGYYSAGELYKTITYDENHTSGLDHSTEEFKDKQGRVVLKRTYGASDLNGDGDTNDSGESNATYDTYYVYDDYSNLTYVLPPKSEPHSAKPDATEMLELCYQYKYDGRNRLVEKKIPGKDWEYIVYDKLDRPILTQDASSALRGGDNWLFTKYDVFGRVAYTGLFWNGAPSTQTAMQNYVDNVFYANPSAKNYEQMTSPGVYYYYTNQSFPTPLHLQIHTVNYYDHYGFDKSGLVIPNNIYSGATIVNYNNAFSTKKLTKGLPTGSKIKVLDQSNHWITTVNGYDDKGRVIWVGSYNSYLQTTDIIENKLEDFTGRLLEMKTTHKKAGKDDIVTVDSFEYDHVDRLLTQKQKINNEDEELITENTYDDIGQLEIKGVGNASSSGTRLQTIEYAYNVRGWLKQINDPTGLGTDLFSFKINYNSPEMGASAVPLYNGNISETIWRTANTSTYGNRKRGYAYQYDALNRITGGQFRRANSTGSSFNEQTNHYNVTGVTYDKNGNINRLNRRGVVNSSNGIGNMDKLDYNYYTNSNKLQSVQELSDGSTTYGFKNGLSASTEYTYDTNGNMLKDLNKGIGTSSVNGITYNYLNLPTEVKFDNSNTKKINYIYDAIGGKLRKIVNDNGAITTTDYAGNYVYENGNLQFFNTSEGYISPVNTANYNSGFNYIYQYKDHLGNIRLSYTDSDGNGEISASAEIIEENNYYPFGLKHKGYNQGGATSLGNNVAQKFKYNGIEYEDNTGLYEMDFRSYDPAIARFTSIDPVTHFSMSTYTAFDNNPVFWADPSGANANGGRITGVEYIGGETVGADGLTNSQWMQLSRPGGGGFDAMRGQARANNAFLAEQERERNALIEVGNLKEIGVNLVETYTQLFAELVVYYNEVLRRSAINEAIHEVNTNTYEETGTYGNIKFVSTAISIDDLKSRINAVFKTSGLSLGGNFWGSITVDVNLNLIDSKFETHGSILLDYNPKVGIVELKEVHRTQVPTYLNETNVGNSSLNTYRQKNPYIIELKRNLIFGFKTHEARKKYLKYFHNLKNEYVKTLSK